MALGVAGCIVLAGTDLTGGRVAGLTAFVAAILLQKAGANGRFIADGVPQNLLLVVLLDSCKKEKPAEQKADDDGAA